MYYQEVITTVNLYAPNFRTLNFTRQVLGIKQNNKTKNSALDKITLGDFTILILKRYVRVVV